ncbi:TrmH family RNA methyltransferase [Oceanibacterium hippocampi]|uniref:23S rRNA (Guanosine-2'-O-)-methyltransferase RlmB n=1 Tax=Oceanibacterium hippocampi TaxID=745714 RepID=A0A1Y5SGZ0_9PROT|nr:RNA methyltransferase [Oceanibacterium hippocampi]SLN39880.1 23S rRNA (guanosine-2'-O-)-methyltransferase RlmB [Oceanibacterium hippocampi]
MTSRNRQAGSGRGATTGGNRSGGSAGDRSGAPRPSPRPGGHGDSRRGKAGEGRVDDGNPGSEGGRKAKPDERRGKHRKFADRPWLYGPHAVAAALANPARRCRRLLVTREAWRRLEADGAALPAGLEAPTIVERERLDRELGPGAVHQGIALDAEPLDWPSLEQVCARRDGAVALVLDQVLDPQNVGAILRSAAAFGALAVIMTDRNAPPPLGSLAKAASGALEIVPLLREVNLARALDKLADCGYWRIGLDGEASHDLSAARPRDRQPVALVLGAEEKGLRRLTRENCDILARLPIEAGMESLNVSNAAAVALYELTRVRRD